MPSLITARDADGRGWCTLVGRRRRAVAAPRHRSARPSRFGIEACTNGRRVAGGVERALRCIDAGRLEKVVLARAGARRRRPALRAACACSPSSAARNRDAPSTAAGGFVGATPELLVRKRGNDVLSRPARGHRDRRRPGSSRPRKDAHEHAVVVDAVVRALTPTCGDSARRRPRTARARRRDPPGNVGLRPVHGRAPRRPSTSCARCIPLPAVAGTPRPAALDAIRRLEPIGRGTLRRTVRLGRRPRRRRVRRRVAVRRARWRRRAVARGCRHRRRIRSRSRVGRNAAEARADAARARSPVTGYAVRSASSSSAVGVETSWTRGRTTIATTHAMHASTGTAVW